MTVATALTAAKIHIEDRVTLQPSVLPAASATDAYMSSAESRPATTSPCGTLPLWAVCEAARNLGIVSVPRPGGAWIHSADDEGGPCQRRIGCRAPRVSTWYLSQSRASGCLDGTSPRLSTGLPVPLIPRCLVCGPRRGLVT